MLIGRNIFFITKNFKIPTIQNSEKSYLLRKVEKYEIKYRMSLQWWSFIPTLQNAVYKSDFSLYGNRGILKDWSSCKMTDF